MFKFIEKAVNGYVFINGFQILLEDGCYKTDNKDIIKVLKSDDRFIEEKKDLSKKETLI
jgi:hypothetical protein